jgi:hypothetical protein
MSHFQNKNKIWINNTLKSSSETLGLLKLLKDIGVFREKPKRKKPKQPKEEEPMPEEEDISPSGAAVGLLPSSNISQALQALKSGVSGQAQQQYVFQKAKEDAELAIGKLRDARQQYFQPQEEEDDFFPESDVGMSEPDYEFTRQGPNNVPETVTQKDISPKVSPEEGEIEEEDVEENIFIPSAAEPEEYKIAPPNSAPGKMAALIADMVTEDGELIGPRPNKTSGKGVKYDYYRKVANYFNIRPKSYDTAKDPLTEVNKLLAAKYKERFEKQGLRKVEL